MLLHCGGPATLAKFENQWGIALDPMNNIYVADYSNKRIRKITYPPTIVADSFTIYINKECSGPDFLVLTNSYSPSLSVRSYFGDGQSSTSSILSGYGGGYANVTHPYSAPGVYSIKQILYNGPSPVDSASYSYKQLFCQSIFVKLYYDTHSDCVYDSTSDPLISLPITVEIDSNGLPVDIISATSGFVYTADGNIGDIYTFRVINSPIGLHSTCPASGSVTDTLISIVDNSTTKYFGFSCSSVTGFDLGENVSMIAGRHMASVDVLIDNSTCIPENAVFTMSFSTQYVFQSAFPAPSSVIGNYATWDISSVSDVLAYLPDIHVTLSVPTPGIPSTWLTPGDTVNSFMKVDPIIGDVDTSNNVIIRTDTIKGSWDPNEMSVAPSGFITSGTKLQYSIQFENTGNDTAFNISVYDTLSDNVDVQSLRVVAASAVMNIIPFKAGGRNIVKFDFPGINLLDSSHYNQCNGMVIFNVNTKSGLPNGTTIFNHAGIFFDDNPVVMTDTVEDIIGIPISTNVSTVSNNSKATVYPNPASTDLTIRVDAGTFNMATITNIVGQEIMTRQLSGAQTIVNVSMLPAGMYYVTLRGEGGVTVMKFEKL